MGAIERSTADNHVLVLKDDAVHTFRGIYALHRGATATNSGGPYANAEKIHGRGPARFDESQISRFLKYDNGKRTFSTLPSRSFTFTTDAIVLQNNLFKPKQNL